MQSAFREAQKISRHLLFMDHLANDGFAGTDQSDKTVSEELFIGPLFANVSETPS